VIVENKPEHDPTHIRSSRSPRDAYSSPDATPYRAYGASTVPRRPPSDCIAPYRLARETPTWQSLL
jgi:hypothetical protein